MTEPLITVDTIVDADPSSVWKTLTQPKSAMFMGAEVHTDWKEGSPITLSGEFGGKSFEDHGEIKACDPERHLAFTHFSGGQTEKGNVVDVRLEPADRRTKVVLSQIPLDEDRPDGAKIAEYRKNWGMMLAALKKAAEEKVHA